MRPAYRYLLCLALCLVSSLPFAQRTISQQPPTLILQRDATINALKFAFKNGLTAKVKGSAQPFASAIDVSYRDPNGAIELEYTRFGSTTDSKLEVFVFNGPAIVSAFNKSGASPVGGFGLTSEVVLSKQLGRVGSKRVFHISTAEFSPVFRPTPKSGTASASPAALDIGSVNPALFDVKMSPSGKARNTAYARNLLNSGIPVTYYFRITDAEGIASSVCQVTVGEPQPPTIRTFLEVTTVPATSEFPDEQFGQSVTLQNSLSRKFRFRAYGPYDRAVFQVSAIPFPSDARKWREDSCNLFRQWSTIPKALPGQPPTSFFANLAKLPSPSTVDQTFFARLILLDENGGLAALPSNVITITVPKVPAPIPPKESWMEFKIDVVGYDPGHLPSSVDAHHFVLNKIPTGKMREHMLKVTGKSNLALGDRLYLPPTPPADKTWWETVKESVAAIIDTINTIYYTVNGVINMFTSMLITVMNMLPKAFLVTIPEELGMNMAGVEAGLDLANKVNGVAHYPMQLSQELESSASFYGDSMLEAAGLSPNQRLLARGKVHAAISNWAKDNRPWNGKYTPDMLIPDPDWIPRPASVKLRVTSIGKGKANPLLLAKPPTVELKMKTLSKNAELLGVNAEWRDVYQKTITLPQMGPGETSTVNVLLDYHWSQSAQPDLWTNAILYAQKAMVTVNGKPFEFAPGNKF